MANWFSGCTAYNLGTGRGSSVLEMVDAFEKASGKVIMHLSDIQLHLCAVIKKIIQCMKVSLFYIGYYIFRRLL